MDLDFGVAFGLKEKEESLNSKNSDSLILFSDSSSFFNGDLILYPASYSSKLRGVSFWTSYFRQS